MALRLALRALDEKGSVPGITNLENEVFLICFGIQGSRNFLV